MVSFNSFTTLADACTLAEISLDNSADLRVARRTTSNIPTNARISASSAADIKIMTVQRKASIGIFPPMIVSGLQSKTKPKRQFLARFHKDGYSGVNVFRARLRSRFRVPNIALAVCLILVVDPTCGRRKEPPAVRWTAGTPGCEFQRGDDGRYRWRWVRDDLDMTLLVDSQELSKSRRRLYKPLSVFLSVTYTGHSSYDFPADLRMQFVRHHNVTISILNPTEFATQMQNDVDTKIFDIEREIKKHPEKSEELTNHGREYQKQVAEFIEFLSTQSLESAILSPGSPEAHGWVFFPTKNKWLGSWKEREDFILQVWMKDKVYQFPFSLPPTEGDLILRKRDE